MLKTSENEPLEGETLVNNDGVGTKVGVGDGGEVDGHESSFSIKNDQVQNLVRVEIHDFSLSPKIQSEKPPDRAF